MHHREVLGRLTVVTLDGDGVDTLCKVAGIDDRAVLVAGLTIDHLTHHVADDDLLQALSFYAERGVCRIREHAAVHVVFTDRSHLDADVVIAAIGPGGCRLAIATVSRHLIIIVAAFLCDVKILTQGLVDGSDFCIVDAVFTTIHLERLRVNVVVPREQRAEAIACPLVFASQTCRRLATAAVVIARIKRGRHLVGVTCVGIDRLVVRVLDVDGYAGDSR